MKKAILTISAVLMACTLSTAQQTDYESMSKEQLITLVERQKEIIDGLKKQVKALWDENAAITSPAVDDQANDPVRSSLIYVNRKSGRQLEYGLSLAGKDDRVKAIKGVCVIKFDGGMVLAWKVNIPDIDALPIRLRNTKTQEREYSYTFKKKVGRAPNRNLYGGGNHIAERKMFDEATGGAEFSAVNHDEPSDPPARITMTLLLQAVQYRDGSVEEFDMTLEDYIRAQND